MLNSVWAWVSCCVPANGTRLLLCPLQQEFLSCPQRLCHKWLLRVNVCAHQRHWKQALLGLPLNEQCSSCACAAPVVLARCIVLLTAVVCKGYGFTVGVCFETNTYS